MGGVVIDMSDDRKRVWPPGCDTLTITPACFEEWLETEAFNDINLGFFHFERRSMADEK